MSPGIGITRGASLVLEGSDFSGRSSADGTLRGEHADFNYKLPFESDIGIMLRFARGEIEADVRYYGSVGRYALYESDSLATITRVSAGDPPTVSSSPFATTYNSAQSITNVAVGGNYRVTSALTLRAGFNSDASPVGTADASNSSTPTCIARRPDLRSIGVAYGWGAGQRRSLATTASGASADTRLEVRTINFVDAFSYAFGGRSGQ